MARRVGADMGPFCRVISSSSPWTFETAIAMGLAVDEQYWPVPFTDAEWAALGQLMPAETDFARVSQVMREDALGRRFADALRTQWAQYALAIPDGESALIVTHGGYIDYSVVACLPSENHAEWGTSLGRCEGARLAFNGCAFVSAQILRVPAKYQPT